MLFCSHLSVQQTKSCWRSKRAGLHRWPSEFSLTCGSLSAVALCSPQLCTPRVTRTSGSAFNVERDVRELGVVGMQEAQHAFHLRRRVLRVHADVVAAFVLLHVRELVHAQLHQNRPAPACWKSRLTKFNLHRRQRAVSVQAHPPPSPL